MFQTTYESRACACGGRRNEIPSVKIRHDATRKHKTWRWQTLCEAMLDSSLSRDAKIAMLREMRDLVAYVK